VYGIRAPVVPSAADRLRRDGHASWGPFVQQSAGVETRKAASAATDHAKSKRDGALLLRTK
jgi:hypothetical protein